MSYNKNRHDVVYHDCFLNADEGHALYKPFSSKDLKPGMCGYFNHTGDWCKIQDLTDTASVVSNGWKPIDALTVDQAPGEDFWPAMKSSWMVKYPIKLEANVNVPQTPMALGFKIGSDSNEEVGAVLVTEGAVTHRQIEPKSSTLVKNWFISNAEKILTDYEVTRKKGIWVITSTYAAKRRAHALVHSKEASVSFEINAQVPGVAALTPSAAWWSRLEEGVWKDHKNDDGVVVFMTGWFWKSSFLSRKPKPNEELPKQQKFLGNESKNCPLEYHFMTSGSIEKVSLNLEKVGKFEEE